VTVTQEFNLDGPVLGAPRRRWLDYRTYLLSSVWLEIRQRVLARSGEQCEICGGGRLLRVYVHHITYAAKWGQEEICDLAALCSPCHARIHLLQKEGGLTQRESFQHVLEKRSSSYALEHWSRIGPTWLRRYLATEHLKREYPYSQKCVPSHEVIERAKECGISMADLKWAKRRVGAVSMRLGDGKWYLAWA